MSAVDRLARQAQGPALALAGSLHDIADEYAHRQDARASEARIGELLERAERQATRLLAYVAALRTAYDAEPRPFGEFAFPVADPAIGGAPAE